MGVPHGNVQGIAGTRFPSHQLSNGLYVSGLPDQHKEKGPTMSVSQMPYTGGDVKKSGELGKMFDIPVESSNSGKPRMPGTMMSKPLASGAFLSHSGPLPSNGLSQTPLASHGHSVAVGSSKLAITPGFQTSKSGPLVGSMALPTRKISNSGPLMGGGVGDHLGSGSMKITQGGTFSKLSGTVSSRSSASQKNSSPLAIALPTTGLITSGPISGPILSAGDNRKDAAAVLDASGIPGILPNGGVACTVAINNLSHDQEFSFKKNFPKVLLWTVVPLFVMGFIAGGFIIAAIQNPVLLIVVAALFISLVVLLLWNTWWGKSSVTGFLEKYPDSELGSAKDGQYVKITGV